MNRDDIISNFSDIIEFLVDGDGGMANHEDNRYRDFVIARQTSYGDENDDSRYSFGEVDLPPESLDHLHKLVRDKTQANIESFQGERRDVVKYGEGRADRSYVKYLTEDDFPLINEIESLVNQQDVEYTTYHEGSEPEFQAIRIKDHQDRMVVGFQHYWRNQLLGNTSLFNLYYQDEGHVPMDEPIISIPKRLDALYYDEVLYIFNDWRFEQMFDYHRIYEEVADQVVETIKDNDIEFSNMGMVEEAVENNPNMMRKLDEVQRQGVYTELDMDDVEWVLDEYPIDGVEVVNQNGERQVKVENKMRVWNLIAVINDDHVESRLTDRIYQADGKTEL